MWALIIGLSVVIVGVAGIMIFFPKEKVKQMAIDKISTSLDRKVTIDGISVSIWGGIGAYLKGIRIANPEGFKKDYFLEAEALDIKLQFWPLLKKQVLVDRLILVSPNIDMEKLRNGRINYKFGVIDSLAPEAVKEKVPEESKLAVSAISFDNLEIKDGVCNYIDDSSKMAISAGGIALESKVMTPKPMVFEATGRINIGALDIATDSLVLPTIKLSAPYAVVFDQPGDKIVLNESNLEVNGIVLKTAAEIPKFSELNLAHISIAMEETDFNRLLTLVPEAYKPMLEGYTISGPLSLKASIDYNTTIPDTLQYGVSVDLSGLSVGMAALPGEVMLKEAALNLTKNRADLNINQANFLNNTIQANIRVNDFEHPKADGRAKGNIDLAGLEAFLPKIGEPKLAGKMDFDFKFKGPIKTPADIQLTGKLNIREASYTATTLPEPIQSFNLETRIDNRDIMIDNFDVTFPSTDFTLKGKLADALPYFLPGYAEKSKKPFLSFELTSKRFNVDKLFPEVAPGQGSNLADLPIDSLPPIILPDIDGRGTGRVGTMVYSGVDFTNITSDITIADRKIKLTDVVGNVYTGQVTGESEIDLNDFENPKYVGTFDAKQIEANDFLSRFTKFGGHLYGKLNMSGSFAAAGLEPEDIIKTLSMNGNALFNEAKLVNFDLINTLAQNFNFKSVDEEKIRDLASKFAVNNGRVEFDKLNFKSSFGDWDVTGSIGFDGTLNYSGDVLLSEKMTTELSSKSGLVGSLAGFMTDSQTGRVKVPFKLGGTYSKPSLSVDLKPAEEKATDQLKDKAVDALQNLLQKKKK